MGTFYNSTYYFVGLVGLVIAGTMIGWRRARTAVIVLTLWWLPFFILYIFMVRFPGTHFYLLMQSWSFLAAIPLAAVTAPSVRPVLRWIAFALIGIWLLVSTHYLYLIFFRQDPEYLINYETEHNAPLLGALPRAGETALRFPYTGRLEGGGRAGRMGLPAWIHDSDDGEMVITYNGNDRAWSLRRWYLTPFKKRDFEDRPDYVFVARHVQEANPDYAAANESGLLDEYVRTGEVLVRGEPRLEIWARTPLPAYVTYEAEDFEMPFPHDVAALNAWPDATPRVQEVALGDTMTLQSAHLDRTRFASGNTIPLTLVWRPEQPLPLDYKLFVHVAGADGYPVAQWDGLPGLNTARTSEWQVGELFRDHVFVPIPEDAPPGEYSLLVGLYDGETGTRLGDAAVPIATVEIR